MDTPTPIGRPEGPYDAVAAAEMLRAIAHPSRLSILRRLMEAEAPVSAFEAELGLKQPSLSQQLAMLREAKLVATRREAKAVYYRLADERVGTILRVLRTLFANGTAHTPAPAAQTRAASPAAGPSDHDPPPATRLDPMVETQACGVFSRVGWPSN
jgi:ArsR family transcriptional regulator